MNTLGLEIGRRTHGETFFGSFGSRIAVHENRCRKPVPRTPGQGRFAAGAFPPNFRCRNLALLRLSSCAPLDMLPVTDHQQEQAMSASKRVAFYTRRVATSERRREMFIRPTVPKTSLGACDGACLATGQILTSTGQTFPFSRVHEKRGSGEKPVSEFLLGQRSAFCPDTLQ